MTLRPAAAIAYAQLKEAEDVEPLNAADAECINDLREVLRRHGRLDRFGVCLLHKHFPMADDEMLVESTDTENRKLTMDVQKRTQAVGPGFIETQWHLGVDGARMGCRMACIKAGGSPSHFKQHVFT